jgi:two-component system, NarL family, response regulator LiaR
LYEEKDMLEPSSQKTASRSENAIKILVADDHPLVRRALRDLVEAQPDMRVIGEAENGQESVELAIKLVPDIVIMDIGMPAMNGLEATRRIKSQCPSIAVLVLTVHTDREHIIGILEAGAAGYLTKVLFGNDIIQAIRAIFGGEAVMTPLVLHEILKQHHPEQSESIAVEVGRLTEKEVAILKLAAQGLNNKSIAKKLSVTENTVKSYLANIFGKINVSSRTEAVIFGLKSGLININDLK